MPRNGAGVYSRPIGATPSDGDDIDAAPYNLQVNDIAADLNTPRPITAGGTGASTAETALAALGGLSKTNNLSDLGSAATARTNLGLPLQTSETDATVGRVLNTPAFGIGSTTTGALLANLDATNIAGGLYRYSAATTGTKPAILANDGTVQIIRGAGTNSLTQILYSGEGRYIWARACVSGVYSAWERGQTSSDVSSDTNFANETGKLPTRAAVKSLVDAASPMTTIAAAGAGAVGTYAFCAAVGASVAEGATVAGTSLRLSDSRDNVGTALAGTWRNLGAAITAGGAATLFVRTA